MGNPLVLAGRLFGGIGILTCAAAVIGRLTGHFYLFDVSAEALLQAGTAAVVIGCFALLLAREPRA
jgi:hypothetical protein